MSVFSIALSGLNAQSIAIGAHAQNIANLSSSGKIDPQAGDRRAYQPVRPVFDSSDTGGVVADVVDIDPSSFAVYDPDSVDANDEGLVAFPNISLEDEVLGLVQSKNAYVASAKVIAVQRDMDRELLDLFA